MVHIPSDCQRRDMSSNQVVSKTKDTWETLKDLLEKTEAQVRKEISQAAPVVQRSVGGSIEAATRGFDFTMKSISNHAEQEQLELLKAYRRFLSGQLGFVDIRMKELEQRTRNQQTETVQGEAWKNAQRVFWFPSDADF